MIAALGGVFVEGALQEFQEASGGVLPVSANTALETLISQSNYTKNFLTQQVNSWTKSSNS